MLYTLGQLAEHVNGKVVGESSCNIEYVATLANASKGTITFLTNSRYRDQLKTTQASAVILREQDIEQCPVNALVVDDPRLAFAKIAALFARPLPSTPGVAPSAVINADSVIHESASIGEHVFIGKNVRIAENVNVMPGCVIEDNVSIGRDSIIMSNVTICHDCQVGEKAYIHPGVVIGSDGFGQVQDGNGWLKVPQLGRVIIGNDVEIGANTSIDRGAIDDTIIGENVKLDNQIQIAHNVQIGAHTVISGCTAIAGSTVIGEHCMIGGAVGIVDHLAIADRVYITAMSLVTKSIKTPGIYSSGTPLDENSKWHKNSVRFKQLDSMAKRIKQLEKQLEQIKAKE